MKAAAKSFRGMFAVNPFHWLFSCFKKILFQLKSNLKVAKSTAQEKNPMVVIGFPFYFPFFFFFLRGGGRGGEERLGERGGGGSKGLEDHGLCGCACACVWMQGKGKDKVRYVNCNALLNQVVYCCNISWIAL